ncbi:MAG: 2-oxo acid dehydrogenase subunit E2 [Gammaproteobacteria bacterium]|nr:2-oxo acid dehydrogenase subunit E2 [Gammaproteobacteria bacterium]
MPKEIYLVKVGMSMTEGMVSEWYIPDGGAVKKGELVYALETEKVNLDVDAEADGIVKHLVEPGVMLAPGDVVGYIYLDGESVPEGPLVGGAAESPAENAEAEAEPVAAAAQAQPVVATINPAEPSGDGRLKSSPAARRLASEIGVDITRLAGSGPGGRIIERDVEAARGQSASSASVVPMKQAENIHASPLARRIAAERGVNLAAVRGSGPGGRIIQADVEAASSQRGSNVSGAAPSSDSGAQRYLPGQSIPLKGMRRTIAQRMHESLKETAQLSMDMAATMDDAVKLRTQLVKEWEGIAKPTFTDLVIRAVAKALREHPQMNSQFQTDAIELMQEVHVGLAVAVPEGLLVPVIRHADQLTLQEIAIESARLANAAREGTLGLDDFAGGTFTVSALGMFGVNSFTPIINRPQSGILGVNQIYDGLAWDGDTPVKTKQMNLSLTWDHRVLDGAPAAEFLATVVELLSEPYRLLV